MWSSNCRATPKASGVACQAERLPYIHCASMFDLLQNFGHGVARISMRSDRTPNADVICASFERFARRHESFLIARLGPGRADSLNSNFYFVAKFRTQLFDFMRTGHHSVDSCFDTQSGEAQDLVVHLGGNADFAQSLFRCAC